MRHRFGTRAVAREMPTDAVQAPTPFSLPAEEHRYSAFEPLVCYPTRRTEPFLENA
ncbi:hypothetical protein BURKHO8Y_540017 [Burkholderia sp. 8Y]|nr:hypothetical protein BURKHO8Y_540017 [Burkholderia sp. 8Y]